MTSWLRDPEAIYRESFATIRAEAELDRVPASAEALAVRLIHACGMTDLVEDLVIDPALMPAGREALEGGARILVDATMVGAGIIRGRLPAENAIECYLDAPGLADRARAEETTRSAAAVDLWPLGGAVIAIGNAPTALFRLLERLSDPATPRPAVILGFPVGFVGAAESKAALAAADLGIPFATVLGRRGGSAMAAAAVNALVMGASA